MKNFLMMLLGAQITLFLLKISNLTLLSWHQTFLLTYVVTTVTIVIGIWMIIKLGKILVYMDELYKETHEN